VAACAQGHTIVVEKSTLPVRTAETVKAILLASQGERAGSIGPKTFSVLSNPEFLAEGTAISDLEQPDRVLIGGEDHEAIEALASIYAHWIPENLILRTNLWSSELSKLTANAFLAQRISSINSIAALCEATGADIQEVATAIGKDRRIGHNFLKAGPGFGGSCFQKDILNLVYICQYYGLHESANYWQKVVDINTWQQQRIASLIVKKLFGTVAQKKIGLLGFAFKANTNDTRESPAICIAKHLLEEGASLLIYDPRVSPSQIQQELGLSQSDVIDVSSSLNDGQWFHCKTLYEAALGADALVVLTEWPEFSNIDWSKISSHMRRPSFVFDTRGILDREILSRYNLHAWVVGNGIET